MKTKEGKFTHELDVYRTEVESATQFFYAYLAVNTVLNVNEKALEIVNQAPLFWRTSIGALHTSFFIALGRVFDQQSKHNIDRLLKIAQENSDIFSAPALEGRKMAGSSDAAEWIADYMRGAYVPSPNDFRRLRGHVKRYRKIYETNYRDIRRKIFAHKELAAAEDTHALYAKTNIREIQKLLVFLNSLYLALWELFHNGRKPVLKPMRYSVASMRKFKRPEWQSRHIQEHIVHETEKFFQIITAESNERVHRLSQKPRPR